MVPIGFVPESDPKQYLSNNVLQGRKQLWSISTVLYSNYCNPRSIPTTLSHLSSLKGVAELRNVGVCHHPNWKLTKARKQSHRLNLLVMGNIRITGEMFRICV